MSDSTPTSDPTATGDPPLRPLGGYSEGTGQPMTPEQFESARSTGISPYPVRVLQIETSSICNFRCDSCPLSMESYDRPEQHMDAEAFGKILDAFPRLEKLELQGVGEVFLNPSVLDLIRTATERGTAVHTFSNASKIDRAMARGIIESGLKLINFSMDGADDETFKRLRKGGTLRRYKRCVQNLLQARARAGSKTPHVGAMSVLSKNNMHQVPKMLAIAEELGLDSITFTKISTSQNPDELDSIGLTEEDRNRLNSMPPYNGKLEVNVSITPMNFEERMDCYWPKHMAYVTVQGDVTPCCNYYDGRTLSMGNVFEQSGEEIWNGPAYREFRKKLWNGDLPDNCKTC